MRKKILFASMAVALAVAAIFGPDLFDLYRLDQYISTSTQAYDAEGPWPHLADACDVCHGNQGNSQNHSYPQLAGQPAPYLRTQLHRFAYRERLNPMMNPMAMTLSGADIEHLAEHYSKQRALGNQYFTPDPSLKAKGQELVQKGGCTTCHGDSLMGGGQFPRIAGQGYDYLLKQLDAFANGDRRDTATGMMNKLASGWSPEERAALANYLASLPVGK